VSLVTDASPDDVVVAWALAAVGGDHLVSMTGLREGGPPWLMRYQASGGAGSTVVRVGAIVGMTGRPDLTKELLRQRRDAFLADALERLR